MITLQVTISLIIIAWLIITVTKIVNNLYNSNRARKFYNLVTSDEFTFNEACYKMKITNKDIEIVKKLLSDKEIKQLRNHLHTGSVKKGVKGFDY